MSRTITVAALVCAALWLPPQGCAAESSDLQQIHNEIQQLKEAYEARIQELEARLARTEEAARAVQENSAQARPPTPQAAAPVTASAGSASNAFNPDISLILSGTYGNLSQNPDSYKITGFQTATDISPGKRGFSLAESELGVSANVDPYFSGVGLFSIAPDNTIAAEEAYIQTLALSHGVTLKAGRFFSGIGYLNEKHAHTWDFADNPLAYRAFLGTQYADDGMQLKWLAPTDTYLELGAELGRGKDFPASDRARNGIGAYTLFAHTGGDIGANQSWRAGLSWLGTSPRDRAYSDTDLAGVNVKNSFSGNSRLWMADFVWKYALAGRTAPLTVQAEYLRRTEDGTLIYDTGGASLGTHSDSYAATQSGAYLQGVYPFLPHWRVGLRGDWLNGGSVDFSSNNSRLARPNYDPLRYTLMLDYAPSEFSLLRLQFAQDKSRQNSTDDELFVQYIMSLGAHGAHKY